VPDYADHYRNLLARHYSWMFDLSFEEKVAEQRALLEPILKDVPRGTAVDLGCGPGFQSMALVELDFHPVHAIDTSEELLQEFGAHIGPLPIHLHRADILSLDAIVPESAAAIVCMGDTLTHLPSYDSVRRLFRAVAAALDPGGLFVLTWRDLTPELTGPARFIPVRSDDATILTCFLESTSPNTVEVHDLVWSRTPSGWTLHTSSYPKLRLSPAWVADALADAGHDVVHSAPAGRLCLTVSRRNSA
jgi:SAM-dependent methyltransferase